MRKKASEDKKGLSDVVKITKQQLIQFVVRRWSLEYSYIPSINNIVWSVYIRLAKEDDESMEQVISQEFHSLAEAVAYLKEEIGVELTCDGMTEC